MDKKQQLQRILAQATALIEEAKALSDQTGVPFEILDRKYEPKKTVTTGGKFDYEPEPTSWEESDDQWASSYSPGC